MSTAACALGTEPPFPDGAARLEPPAPYRLWWALAEQCSGVAAPFESVAWYHVPGAEALTIEGRTYHGIWYATGNRIVLAGGAVHRATLVRHEMLHALLQTGGHPAEQFSVRCAGYVACGGQCAAAAAAGAIDPDPPGAVSGAQTVASTDLAHRAQLFPAAPSVAQSGGWVALVLEARNPSNEAVSVRLTPVAPGQHAAATFGWAVGGRNQGYAFVWDTLLAFGPGATRRHVEDIRLPEGEYAVSALFNTDTVATLPLHVGP